MREDHELMMSRLDWITESLFLESPSVVDTSSTNFQILISGEGILMLLIMIKNKIGPNLVP